MKIAICTISTDGYWNKYSLLKESISKYFLKNHSVNSFVYTDKILHEDNIFHTTHLPSPLITLMKFNFLLQQENVFKNYDLLYYIDGDCRIVDEIDEEVFPNEQLPIVATKHPWQHYQSKSYDDNKLSSAFVENSGDNHYLQACFFGGYTQDVLHMSNEISNMIKQDLKNRYIAKWFDESYFNKFLLNKPVKLLSAAYAFPDPNYWKHSIDLKPKIIHENSYST